MRLSAGSVQGQYSERHSSPGARKDERRPRGSCLGRGAGSASVTVTGWGAPGHLVPPRKEEEGGDGAGRVEDPAGHWVRARAMSLESAPLHRDSAPGLPPTVHLDLDLGAVGPGWAGLGPPLALPLHSKPFTLKGADVLGEACGSGLVARLQVERPASWQDSGVPAPECSLALASARLADLLRGPFLLQPDPTGRAAAPPCRDHPRTMRWPERWARVSERHGDPVGGAAGSVCAARWVRERRHLWARLATGLCLLEIFLELYRMRREAMH